MPLQKVKKIWRNGKLINWDDAQIHVLSHVVHYGTCWFEGIKCYDTKQGPAVFRLEAHLRRLLDSAKIYRTDIPYTVEELKEATLETIRANNLKSCYIRPFAIRGYYEMGISPLNCPVDVYIAVWEWGKYLGEDSVENGIDVCVSSWNRMAPNTLPAMAKAGSNYMNSQLIKMEALKNGYAEGIALDVTGHVSEGSGENLFLIKNGVIHTTPLSASILQGITRDSVIRLADELGYEVRDFQIPRELLYIADELFFTGTAAEITPIRSVDRIQIGSGKPGPITKQILKKYSDIVKNGKDKRGWLTFVYK
ncbi:MAG TPA: branched-chain amino acid transaminase [Ignavibacteria bacterium]|jgi:branched-chain amino acid aminotransferase